MIKMSHLLKKSGRYKKPAVTRQLSIIFAQALMIPLLAERVVPVKWISNPCEFKNTIVVSRTDGILLHLEIFRN